MALLVDDPDLESLLIAGFSGVETLGRTELPKAAAERLLAGGSLGLTNAEVALVVERGGERGVVKVVQCESAATAVVLELPKMPVEETARWIVARTQPLLGAVADPMRPRISLPGLRFVTDSAENRSAERAINLILTARLQARGAAVLERWRMRDLVFEKSLAAQESPFWKAAEIVDGSVSAAGGKLTARVRIRDAAGAETMVQAEGGTAESLAEEVSARVMAARWKTKVGTRNETEAAAFLAEAKWMLEHGLPREGWQATESALALGVEPRREAEMLRVKAAAMCAYPDDLKTTLLRDGHYRAKAFALSELPARVEAATEAMLLAGDYCNAYAVDKTPGWALEHPAALGVRSLYSGLRVLRTAHDSGWADSNADAVRGLREAIRRNVALLEGAVLLEEQRLLFFINLANYAGYWNETPGEAIAFYRMVLRPDFEGGVPEWPEVIRSELSYGALAYGAIPRPPFLTGAATVKEFPSGIGGWRVPGRDEASARAAWGAFVDELDRSSLVLHQADGLALRWQSTADKSARLVLTARIADFVAEHVDALAGPQGFAIFGQLVEPLRDVNRSSELASAQEKVVGVFLTLLRSESPVSPLIIAHIRTIFSQGEINVREDQGRALLAALDARRARPLLGARDLRWIDSARESIWKKFPALHPMETAQDALVVQALWIAREHGPAAIPEKHAGFAEGTAVWWDAHLWVLDSEGGGLWKVDLPSGDATIITPENWPKRSYRNNEAQTVFESQLVPWGGKFAVTLHGGVWVLDELQQRWGKLDLPAARYWIGVAHGELWAVSGEFVRAGREKQSEGSALYRISPELTCELVASSRRRPPVHRLDSVLGGAPFLVSPSRTGGVIIGTDNHSEPFTFFDSEGAALPETICKRFAGIISITSSPGLVMIRRYPDADWRRPGRIELLDSETGELLLTHPELKRPGQARFPYPKELENLPLTGCSAAWRDGGLDVLAWSSSGSPWGASEAWLARIDAGGSTVRPLRFAWSADMDQRVRTVHLDGKVFRYPKPDAKGLIATDQGLVITGSAMNGFWFIPKEDLDARRTRMREPEGK